MMKKINDGIEDVKDVIQNLKLSLLELMGSVEEHEEDEALKTVYRILLELEIESESLRIKIDNYLFNKIFVEEDE